MIPPITHPSTRSPFVIAFPSSQVLHPNFGSLSFPEKLKSIGLFDDHFNLLFTPSKIPRIKEQGQIRFCELMNKQVHCPTTDSETVVILKESDYISGLKATLKEKGIETKTFLRGSYAAHVACLADYFEFLVHEFLASKKLPKNLFTKELNALKNSAEEAPHDVDLFDQILNSNMPAEFLKDFSIEYFRSLSTGKIKFLQKLIPEVCPLFPYPEDYVLFTIGTKEFQTDRIIGKLHHEYLYTRDDIRIEIKDNKISVPESAGNFWQMVLDRKFKIVRTEKWHEKDFRAGLAAIQLIHHDHLLIEEGCTLQSILRYAVSTGSDKILTGAIDRARLHCQNSFGFLLNVLIAYTHANPKADFSILTDAIRETGHEVLPLAGLYKLALLLTIYKDKTGTYRAEWDTCGKGLLTLYLKEHRIIFPKNFAITSTERPFFACQISSWGKGALCPSSLNCVYKALDGELSCLERVLFELALQKPLTPLTEEMKEALVDYLTQDNTVPLADLFHPWIPVGKGHLGWVKALLSYSFKHGLRLWNALDGKQKLAGLEEIINLIAPERPNFSYALVGDEPISKELRLKLLKVLGKSPNLSHDLGRKILDELITDASPSHIPTIDRLMTEEHEEWFFNSKPSEERIEAFYLKSKNLNVLIKGITHNQSLPLLQKYKNVLKGVPETYIKLIKLLHSESLVKEWIGSFPQSEQVDQILIFFTEYSPADHPLLDSICSLPGLNEKKLLETLSSQGRPVFADRPFSKLMTFLKFDFLLEVKEEFFRNLAKLPLNNKDISSLHRWMKDNPPLSLELLGYFLESESYISLALPHLLHLKSIKYTSPLFDEHLRHVLAKPEALGELIPFYKDRKWVKSVYGADAEVKTKEWGEALLSQGKLEEIKRAAVIDILSRTTLIYPQPLPLIMFLQSSQNHQLIRIDKLKAHFQNIVSTLLISIKYQDQQGVYSLDRLFKLFKLAMAAKIYTIHELALFEGLDYFPLLTHEGGTFAPLFHLLQTLPLIDFGSKEGYNEWNDKRNEILQKWKEMPSGDNEPLSFKILKEAHKLEILPYELVQASLEYSHLFKLITEQYIEDKATREEFQEEVRALSLSAAQKFKSHPLSPSEDPCLICINDLSFLLKNTKKRVRAYEAFYYLLQKQPQRGVIKEQRNYLEIRQKTEDLILAKTKLRESNQLGYTPYLRHIALHLADLIKVNLRQDLHIPDPLLDAFELDSIEILEKMDLQKIWLNIVNKGSLLYNAFQENKIKGYILSEKNKLIETEVESHLQKRTEALKKIINLIPEAGQRLEIDSITETAHYNLSKEKNERLMQYMEKTLSRKVPKFMPK